MFVNKPSGMDAAPKIGRSLSRMWLRTGTMMLSGEKLPETALVSDLDSDRWKVPIRS